MTRASGLKIKSALGIQGSKSFSPSRGKKWRCRLRPKPLQLHRLGPQLRSFSIAPEVNVLEPIRVISVGKIFAVMGAAAVFAQERAAGDQLGSSEEVAQV